MAKAKYDRHDNVIYDVLYGFVPITEWEEKIISSPFYQRLRQVRQLGFTNYVFPGAEHNRFTHAIGVMHSMDQMVRALNLHVADEELFNPKATNEKAMLHKSLRIAALLHDVGTFPFSHAVEYSYIAKGRDKNSNRTTKDLPNSHEHLGSFIIKNTDYDGGITRVLNDYGFDMQMISKIIKGESPHTIANQLMHSDLDADRMDYLLRDSHYTGIKYGQFDREYILSNLVTFDVDKKRKGFGVEESAMHAVDHFLIGRFNWYSQIIRAPNAAKFDIMASKVAKELLDLELLHSFEDLLSMVEFQGEQFHWWTDTYFMTVCQNAHYKKLIRDPHVAELVKMLLYRHPPKTIEDPLFEHKILDGKNSGAERKKLVSKIDAKVNEMRAVIKKHGDGSEWILTDIPNRDVKFTSSYEDVVKKRKGDNIYAERDPVKIVTKSGTPTLLVEHENSLVQKLSYSSNFVPSVFANESAYELLKRKKLIKE